MKVVFLDFDGVLNSYRSLATHGAYPHRLPADAGLFDPLALGALRLIVRQAQAKIVLSTAWRHTTSEEAAAAFLELDVLGKTRTDLPAATRGEEIDEWLQRHPNVSAYAIVDDAGDILPSQQPHFVQVQPEEGFLWRDAVKLAAILGINPDQAIARHIGAASVRRRRPEPPAQP